MIEIKNLTKIFKPSKNREVVAIKNINLTINKGQVIVLKGASGSGKSTILSQIAGLSKPTNGEVIVQNEHISKYPEDFLANYRQNKIGFIFQKFNLIDTLNVKENIIVPLIPKNLSEQEIKEKLNHVMEIFNISHKQEELIKNLSGGEQQRVAIARSMINNPEIILADEPTANLDESLSKSFLENIRKLKDDNKTIIIATHDPLFFDLDIVDKTIEIKNGELISC